MIRISNELRRTHLESSTFKWRFSGGSRPTIAALLCTMAFTEGTGWDPAYSPPAQAGTWDLLATSRFVFLSLPSPTFLPAVAYCPGATMVSHLRSGRNGVFLTARLVEFAFDFLVISRERRNGYIHTGGW